MLNPFDNINNTNNKLLNTITNIEIWVEMNGRKKNTYISGWNLPINTLKEHVKNIKKNYGCNGTIKNQNSLILMFQGNQIQNIITYISNYGITIDDIHIKG